VSNPVEVYPEALTVLDVETKLYPFMLAAQAVGDMDSEPSMKY
jgi:hypothetical protein